MKHCPNCGEHMPPMEDWPRQCASCNRQHFKNPIPVSVVILPVDDGVLTIRRAIPPNIGELALPGGFVNWGETWQEAGAREVFEETGITIEASELEMLGADSVSEGVILLFSLAEKRRACELEIKVCESEISEAVIVTEPCELAFPTHTQWLNLYFSQRQNVPQ